MIPRVKWLFYRSIVSKKVHVRTKRFTWCMYTRLDWQYRAITRSLVTQMAAQHRRITIRAVMEIGKCRKTTSSHSSDVVLANSREDVFLSLSLFSVYLSKSSPLCFSGTISRSGDALLLSRETDPGRSTWTLLRVNHGTAADPIIKLSGSSQTLIVPTGARTKGVPWRDVYTEERGDDQVR